MGSKFKYAITNVDLFVSSLMLLILVLLTFIGVIMRYVFSSPFNWMEEIQLLCQVWVVFSGGVAAFRLGSHVAIEFVAESLPEIGQKIVLIVNTVVSTAVLGYLGYQSWQYLQVFLKSGRTTTILNISFVLIYIIAPISILLMTVNYLASIKKSWHEIETTLRGEIRAGK